jgi:hypothetical protein
LAEEAIAEAGGLKGIKKRPQLRATQARSQSLCLPLPLADIVLVKDVAEGK